jgi:Putative adhesin
MSNQEMQFADPDWKPSQQLDAKTNPREQEAYNPQPVNTDSREQSQWRTVPPSPPQQEGYSGLRPYAGTAPQQMQGQGGNFRQQRYRRRGRGPWFWIIAAIILISLMSGGFGSHGGSGFGQDRFGNKPPIERTYDYTVNGQPTIVISDTNGNVTVTEGQSNTGVTIQAMNENNPFGNPNDIQPNIIQNANNITANVQGSVDLQVTVPKGANLNLHTESGNITFDGTISTSGTYLFQTNNGTVDLTVPSNSAFHLDASTTSGSINLNPGDFPGVRVQENSSGAKANGNVGQGSSGQSANVTINTDGGDINLHQG